MALTPFPLSRLLETGVRGSPSPLPKLGEEKGSGDEARARGLLMREADRNILQSAD